MNWMEMLVPRETCRSKPSWPDLLALTKLNFNSAGSSDDLPVTLRFADQVGEILTDGPNDATAPLPFKF